MFTAYIIDKLGFTLLWELLGGQYENIPDIMREEVTEENYEAAVKKLSDVGYAHYSEGKISIERTIEFLVSSILHAREVSRENNGKHYVFRCEKLIIIAESDRFSAKKIKLVPVQNEKMLAEYIREAEEDESDND